MSSPLEHFDAGFEMPPDDPEKADDSEKPTPPLCARDQGYTALATEKAGVSMLNPAAELVTKLLCNRCGAVLDAPAVEHPARQPGFRAP